jgi:hypothetical protein
VSEKRITYKLVEANDKQVVVETVVTEREFLGFVRSAPTRYIYPAQVRKEYLDRFLQSTGAKTGEDTLKCQGKELKVKTIAGTIKGSGARRPSTRSGSPTRCPAAWSRRCGPRRTKVR